VSKQSPLPLFVGCAHQIFDLRFEYLQVRVLSLVPPSGFICPSPFQHAAVIILQRPKVEKPRLPNLKSTRIMGHRFWHILEPKMGPHTPRTGSFSDPVFGVRFGANIGCEAHCPPGQAPFWTPVSCACGPPLAVLTGAVFFPELEVREPLFRGSMNLDSLH
jgi:hypothetical protein